MKKIYFIAAACAAMGMSSCSNDILEESALLSDSNLISFNVNAGKSTKADITTANLTEFNATAIINSNSNPTKYFDNVKYAKNGQTFSSENPYYWPESDALNFFAYAPVTAPTGNTLKRNEYKEFVVAPSRSKDADYLDLIYANTNGQTKEDQGKSGVALNFRHAESKILVKVKNSAPNLKFVITDWKLAYLDGEATFTYKDASTTGRNKSQLAYADWENNDQATVEIYYTHSAGSSSTPTVVIPGGKTETTGMAGSMILIPQQTRMAAKYVTTTAGGKDGDPLNGSYIGFKFQILNNDSETVIFGNTDDEWAIWPVSFNWEPGKQYTYIVDLCGGGYYEENHPEINPGTDDPDPILGDDAIIKFVDVTVDDWSEQTPQEVNMPLSDAVLKAASSFKPLSDGSIAYSGNLDKTATLSVKSTDFQTPDPTNPNDNNAFKDVKSFFDGLQYTGTPVLSIKLELNKTDYTFTWNDSKKCWYNAEFKLAAQATPGSSIEAAAATTIYNEIASYIKDGTDTSKDFTLDATLTAKVKNGQNVTEYTDSFKFVINVTK